jgi:hypothetical protein
MDDLCGLIWYSGRGWLCKLKSFFATNSMCWPQIAEAGGA